MICKAFMMGKIKKQLLIVVSYIKENKIGGTCTAQSGGHPTLDFGSGHDPRVIGSSSASGSVMSMEPA